MSYDIFDVLHGVLMSQGKADAAMDVFIRVAERREHVRRFQALGIASRACVYHYTKLV